MLGLLGRRAFPVGPSPSFPRYSHCRQALLPLPDPALASPPDWPSPTPKLRPRTPRTPEFGRRAPRTPKSTLRIRDFRSNPAVFGAGFVPRDRILPSRAEKSPLETGFFRFRPFFASKRHMNSGFRGFHSNRATFRAGGSASPGRPPGLPPRSPGRCPLKVLSPALGWSRSSLSALPLIVHCSSHSLARCPPNLLRKIISHCN